MMLETNRLILREWQPGDKSDLMEGLGNIEVSKWLAFVPHPYTEMDAERWLECCRRNALRPSGRMSYEFAIELKEEEKVIGGVGLTIFSEHHGTAGGGIWINAKYHGRGYGREAFGERIRFAFENLELRRLESGFFEGNHASLKIQRRFGYVVEGKRRLGFRCMADGLLKDEHITGLLREEWKP